VTLNHTAEPRANQPPPRRAALWITVLILFALTAVLMWRGCDYYRLDLASRAEHRDYRLLNPAGLIGHGYGILGTALIATNLLYLVRRRFAKVLPNWVGSMKAWLNAHVFTGLVGSLLVVFHSAFQLRTPIATLTSVSLAIVVATGLVGLYLYALVPKSGLQPLKNRLAEIEPLMPGFARCVDDFVQATPATRLAADASFLRAVFTVPRWVLDARTRRRGMAKAARGDKLFRALEITEPRLARSFLVELGDLAAAEIDTLAGSALMRSWRSLHRFLALVMIVSVSVHIGVAWYYGFTWIFQR
jgi:hypothetical protein